MPEVLFVKATDDYRRGRYEDALRKLDEMDDPRVYGPGYLRLATLGRLGRSEEIDATLLASSTDRASLERRFYPVMVGRHIVASLVEDLRVGLIEGGFKIAPTK